MSNRVCLKEGIIYQHADNGGITVESLKEDLEELLKIQAELQKQNQPLYLLYDGSNIKNTDSAVRAQALDNMSHLDYKRVAIIGVKSVFLQQMAKLIIFGLRKKSKIKIFSSKVMAEHWLRTGSMRK